MIANAGAGFNKEGVVDMSVGTCKTRLMLEELKSRGYKGFTAEEKEAFMRAEPRPLPYNYDWDEPCTQCLTPCGLPECGQK